MTFIIMDTLSGTAVGTGAQLAVPKTVALLCMAGTTTTATMVPGTGTATMTAIATLSLIIPDALSSTAIGADVQVAVSTVVALTMVKTATTTLTTDLREAIGIRLLTLTTDS